MTTRPYLGELSLTKCAPAHARRTAALVAIHEMPGVVHSMGGSLTASGSAAIVAGCAAVERGAHEARLVLPGQRGLAVRIAPDGLWMRSEGAGWAKLADDLLGAISAAGVQLGRRCRSADELPSWTSLGPPSASEPVVDEVALRPFDREVEPVAFLAENAHLASCRKADGRSFLYGWHDWEGIVAALVAMAQGLASEAELFVADHPLHGDAVHYRCRVVCQGGAWSRFDDGAREGVEVGRNLCDALAVVSFELGRRKALVEHGAVFRTEPGLAGSGPERVASATEVARGTTGGEKAPDLIYPHHLVPSAPMGIHRGRFGNYPHFPGRCGESYSVSEHEKHATCDTQHSLCAHFALPCAASRMLVDVRARRTRRARVIQEERACPRAQFPSSSPCRRTTSRHSSPSSSSGGLR
jgi:hypothetical protein